MQCDEDSCQERNVSCVQYDTSIPDEAWPINDSFCAALSPRPPGVRNCGGGICQRGVWSAPPFDQVIIVALIVIGTFPCRNYITRLRQLKMSSPLSYTVKPV